MNSRATSVIISFSEEERREEVKRVLSASRTGVEGVIKGMKAPDLKL